MLHHMSSTYHCAKDLFLKHLLTYVFKKCEDRLNTSTKLSSNDAEEAPPSPT